MKDLEGCLLVFAGQKLVVVAVPDFFGLILQLPLVRYLLILLDMDLFAQVARDSHVFLLGGDVGAQAEVLAHLLSSCREQLEHRVVGVVVRDSSVGVVREYVQRISDHEIAFFDVEPSQQFVFVLVILALNRILKQSLRVAFCHQVLGGDLRAVGKQFKYVMLGNEVTSFVFATQLILADEQAEQSVVLLLEVRVDALAQRHDADDDFVQLQKANNFKKHSQAAADVLFNWL